MIRYLYSIGFLVSCLGLPLQAKDVTPSLPTPSTSAEGKGESKGKSSSTTSSTTTSTSVTGKTHDQKVLATTVKDKKSSSSSTAKQESRSSSSAAVSTSSLKKNDTTCSLAKTSKSSARKQATDDKAEPGEHLARLTAYWAGEGDYYTGHDLSATGIHLHDGHCAVDPRIIPYGSQVTIAGLGTYLAVDTGSAVISREAARETGRTSEERNALVIDLFFEHARDGERFAASGPKFAAISWRSPRSADSETKEDRGLIAEENWTKEHNKDL